MDRGEVSGGKPLYVISEEVESESKFNENRYHDEDAEDLMSSGIPPGL